MASQKILKTGSIILSLFAVLCLGGCVKYFGYDGPYEGKVVDVETGQPIEGAVVHGGWYKASPGPGGATHTNYDSLEVLTDRNGEFKIPGQGLQIFSSLEPMDVTILKAGYSQISAYVWGFTVDSGVELKSNNKAIFKLRRMTMEEREKRRISMPDRPSKKLRLLVIEHNKEIAEIGWPSKFMLPVE